MRGLSLLKRAECRSVITPGLDDFPHQYTTIRRVRPMIRENHLTVRVVADEVGIRIGFCHQILLKNFRCVAPVKISCCVF